jgi:hypothetical protein
MLDYVDGIDKRVFINDLENTKKQTIDDTFDF